MNLNGPYPPPAVRPRTYRPALQDDQTAIVRPLSRGAAPVRRRPLSREAARARRRALDWHDFRLVLGGVAAGVVVFVAGAVVALMLVGGFR